MGSFPLIILMPFFAVVPALLIAKRQSKFKRILYGQKLVHSLLIHSAVQFCFVLFFCLLCYVANRRQIAGLWNRPFAFNEWIGAISLLPTLIGTVIGSMIGFLFAPKRALRCMGLSEHDIMAALAPVFSDAGGSAKSEYTFEGVTAKVKWAPFSNKYCTIRLSGKDKARVDEMQARVVAGLQHFEDDGYAAPRFSLRSLLIGVVLAGCAFSVAAKSSPWDVVKSWTLPSVKAPAIAISDDNSTVAAGTADGKLTVWRLAPETSTKEINAGDSGINSVAFSPNGKQLVSADKTGRLCIWDVESKSVLHDLKTGIWPCVTWSPDGKRIASCDGDGMIWVWTTSAGNLVAIHSLPDVQALSFTSGSSELSVYTFTNRYREIEWNFETDTASDVAQSMYYIATPADVANFNGYHGYLRYYHGGIALYADKLSYSPIQELGPAEKATFSRDRTRILTSFPTGRVELWQQIYPETWWGIVYLKELWIMVAMIVVFYWSIWKDNRKPVTTPATSPH